MHLHARLRVKSLVHPGIGRLCREGNAAHVHALVLPGLRRQIPQIGAAQLQQVRLVHVAGEHKEKVRRVGKALAVDALGGGAVNPRKIVHVKRRMINAVAIQQLADFVTEHVGWGRAVRPGAFFIEGIRRVPALIGKLRPGHELVQQLEQRLEVRIACAAIQPLRPVPYVDVKAHVQAGKRL